MTPTPAFGVLLVGDPPSGGVGGVGAAVGVVVVVVVVVVEAVGVAAALGAAAVKCGVSFSMSCGLGW